ncbi:lanthionine synthetase LanC family protein [Pontivivens insulae]|uniref:Nisin biosynthesis protein NisC n=1 Tax=Pontivivens insulae TaxID=1639689 RepID=A0A2R8AFX3_9RHOB|nr:lanthionine synthetase LanC family protein [Pontivivens insulae]RED10646.1 lanthionine synthetase-like protein [Pontivivens insulae]SPF31144.1 hypothetical protein POI8812_03495 [Pontivivens insulae]
MISKKAYHEALLQGLLDGSAVTKDGSLWLAQFDDDELKLLRNPYKGLGGLLYLWSQFLRCGIGEDTRDRARELALWLLEQHPTEDMQMPGLYAGEAGVAIAILEAVKAGILEGGSWLDDYFAAVSAAVAPSLDITHGEAGQGLAFLKLAKDYDVSFFEPAGLRAEQIMAAQRSDGGWDTAWGQLAGQEPPQAGFAHGVAGITYFLTCYADAVEDNGDVLDAASKGADWMWAHRLAPTEARSTVQWGHTIEDEGIRNFWCHGALGIGLTFLELWKVTGDAKHLDRAMAALDQDHDYFRIDDLGICHGVAGHGEIQLTAYFATGEQRFRERAVKAMRWLHTVSQARSDTGLTWLTAQHATPVPTMSLMTGGGGIAHFLFRLSANMKSMRFPLL